MCLGFVEYHRWSVNGGVVGGVSLFRILIMSAGLANMLCPH